MPQIIWFGKHRCVFKRGDKKCAPVACYWPGEEQQVLEFPPACRDFIIVIDCPKKKKDRAYDHISLETNTIKAKFP